MNSISINSEPKELPETIGPTFRFLALGGEEESQQLRMLGTPKIVSLLAGWSCARVRVSCLTHTRCTGGTERAATAALTFLLEGNLRGSAAAGWRVN